MAVQDRFRIRTAADDDMDLLFQWANDPQVRANAFHTEPIPYEDHKKWFSALMKDDTQVQYIFMLDNNPIGQIRFSIRENEAEIGYSIARDMRGKGYGKIMLEMAKQELIASCPNVKKLVGKVKKENIFSKKCFIECGYDEYYTQYELHL